MGYLLSPALDSALCGILAEHLAQLNHTNVMSDISELEFIKKCQISLDISGLVALICIFFDEKLLQEVPRGIAAAAESEKIPGSGAISFKLEILLLLSAEFLTVK